MRRILLLGAAFSLAACGRILQGGPDDVGTTASGIDCVYGKIATVPGLPLGIASTGKTIFAVTADVGGVIGDLFAITSDGAVHPVVRDDAYVGMAVYGSTVAFNRRSFDRVQNFLGATVELVNPDFSTTTIDSTNANVVQLDSLTTDGSSLYWYRWAPPSDPYDTGIYGTPTIAKYEGSTTLASLGSDAASPLGLFTDGADYFSLFNLPNDFGIVGRLPVNGASSAVLATSQFTQQFASVVGVDDVNVVYLSYGSSSELLDGWTVPKNGGTPVQIATEHTLASSPRLFDHHLYWGEQNADGSASVSRVSTSGGGAIETVATSKTPIPTLTTDACGVVYATTDSADPGLTSASIFRAKF